MSELRAETQKADATKLPLLAPPPNPFQGSNSPILPTTPKQGVAEEKTVLDEGPVTLWLPVKMSQDSVRDFEYWMQGLIRKVRRKAGFPPEERE